MKDLFWSTIIFAIILTILILVIPTMLMLAGIPVSIAFAILGLLFMTIAAYYNGRVVFLRRTRPVKEAKLIGIFENYVKLILLVVASFVVFLGFGWIR